MKTIFTSLPMSPALSWPVRKLFASILGLVVVIACTSARAADVYWDANGATAGSGVTPSGTWNSDAFWSTSAAGTNPTTGTAPTIDDNAVFSAGSDASGDYTVTISGTGLATLLQNQSGDLTLSGGTLSLKNNTASSTPSLQALGTSHLTVDSTILVNNSGAIPTNNYFNMGTVAGTTITINSIVTASTTNRFLLRQVGAGGHVIINSDLGTDSNVRSGMAVTTGGISGAQTGGTLTLNGAQTLGTGDILMNTSSRLGTVNIGSTVTTSAVQVGAITLLPGVKGSSLAGGTLNLNSAVTASQNVEVAAGAILNVAGSLSASSNTTLGLADADTHVAGGTMNILNSGTATLGAITVRDGTVLTNGGTLSGDGLVLGEATANTSGTLVLGDATGVGTTTLTGIRTAGTGTENAIIGGNGAVSTLTVNVATNHAFSGVIGGTGTNENNVALVKGGSASLTLSGLNSYTGNTTVNAGTLILADNATLNFAIGATGINNGIDGTGTLTLDGDFTFDLTDAAVNGSWNIVDVASLTESFGSTFTVQGFAETGVGSNVWEKTVGSSTYTFTESSGLLTAVPEPSTWLLLTGAGLFLTAFRRRRA